MFRNYKAKKEKIRFAGQRTFRDCYFSGTPEIPEEKGNAKPTFINCSVNNRQLRGIL